MLNEVRQIQIPGKHGNEKLAQEGKEMQTCKQSNRITKIGRDSKNTLKVKRVSGNIRHLNFNISTLKKKMGGKREKKKSID